MHAGCRKDFPRQLALLYNVGDSRQMALRANFKLVVTADVKMTP
jgi:hypothetical protein